MEAIMGAWGTGIFESEGALDALDKLMADKAPLMALSKALQGSMGAGYVDSEAGQATLVAAAVIDHCLYGAPIEPDCNGFEQWAAWLEMEKLRPLTHMAADGVDAVTGEDSELRERWSETMFFDEWSAGLLAMRDRLRIDLDSDSEK
jgi:hypothetical protein